MGRGEKGRREKSERREKREREERGKGERRGKRISDVVIYNIIYHSQ